MRCVLRDCVDEEAVKRAEAALRSRLTLSAGGQVDECSSEWLDAPRLFPKTKMVEAYNSDRLQDLRFQGKLMLKVRASHTIIQRYGPAQRVLPRKNKLPSNADECGGLEEVVCLAEGARVMLRRNVDTSDGLVNGAVGTIVGFEWPEGNEGDPAVMPAAVNVRFDNPRVGSMWRRAQGTSDPSIPVQIVPSIATFSHKGKTWQRAQFPFLLAWAMTIHKVQGLSMEKAVVDLGKDIFAEGQAYVALRPVKTLEGLAITGLCEESVRMVSAEALQEYARLGIGRYQPHDIALASLRSASFPAHGEDEDNDGVEEDNDGDNDDAPPQTPASPARQIPMSFARLISPRNYNSQLSGVSALAAGASVILSSRQKE